MADLYNTPVGVNTRKSSIVDERVGAGMCWLVVENGDGDFEGGSTYNPSLTTRNSTNFQVVQAIQQWCEVIQVVRPSSGLMSIQVRANTVPYADGEAMFDGGSNSILTNAVRTALDSSSYTVWNGAMQDDDINWD
jgi:hypothetical protein